jgi:uncharacterized protein YbdZ (MbtH family)
VCAEIEGGTGGESLTRVKLLTAASRRPGELLAGPASVLGSAPTAESDGGCVVVFAKRDQAEFSCWAIARQLPAAWPQAQAGAALPWCLTRSPLVPPTGAP